MGISVFAAEQTDLGLHPEALLADVRTAEGLDSPAMNELLTRYEPLIKSVVRSMGRPDWMFDDLLNGGRWGLVQAVLHHDGRREGVTSYLKRYVRGEAERAVERQQATDISTAPEDLPETESLMGLPGSPEYDEVYFKDLSPTQNLLVVARYRDDKPLAQIARTDGCSVSAVSQRLGTIHRKLSETYSRAA